MAPAQELPPRRRELADALADIDAHGIGLLSGAFARAEVDEARRMVASLAASELDEGCAMVSFGTHRVFGLIQKGAVFRRIASHPTVLALAHKLLGPRINLFSMQAHIVPQGGDMDPHFDQNFDQTDYAQIVPFDCMCAVVVMLDEFTEANGATQIAVGCYARDAHEPPPPLERMRPMTGASGDLAAYGGRLWHSTGINRTPRPRTGMLIHYCQPWVRQHENYGRTISAALARDMTPRMRDLLGVHERLVGRRWHAASPEYRPKLVTPEE